MYNLSVFSKFHPGGKAVLLDEEIAGQDATNAFFALHRYEVLLKPAYKRLQIGRIKDQKKNILPREPGELRLVPYAEPVSRKQGFSLLPVETHFVFVVCLILNRHGSPKRITLPTTMILIGPYKRRCGRWWYVVFLLAGFTKRPLMNTTLSCLG